MNDSRDHILTTSLKLFLQKSFKEVTMKEIVEHTGLSKGAFYHYFTSKEQVFTEVINHFFREYMHEDYSQLPTESLAGFYQSILVNLDRRNEGAFFTSTREPNDEEAFNINHYYLLFDAIRMLPAFKQKQLDHQQEEFASWTTVVTKARSNGEIRSAMTDEQIAKLFIYLSDGVGINYVMTEGLSKVRQELQSLWDGLYNTLKV